MAARLKALTPELTAIHKLGAELRRARIRAGMSQPELASALYTSKSTVSRAETGVRLLARDLVEVWDDLVQAEGLLISMWQDAAADVNASRALPPPGTDASAVPGERLTRTREASSLRHVARCTRRRQPRIGRCRCVKPLACPPHLQRGPRRFGVGVDRRGPCRQPPARPRLSALSPVDESPQATSQVQSETHGRSQASTCGRWRPFARSISAPGLVSNGASSVTSCMAASRSPPSFLRPAGLKVQ